MRRYSGGLKNGNCVCGARAVNRDSLEGLLREMERCAKAREVPILAEAARPVFLRTVREAAPLRILELGTAIGYSALLALRESPDARIVTIERDADMAEAARSFLGRAGVLGRATVLVGGKTVADACGEF